MGEKMLRIAEALVAVQAREPRAVKALQQHRHLPAVQQQRRGLRVVLVPDGPVEA